MSLNQTSYFTAIYPNVNVSNSITAANVNISGNLTVSGTVNTVNVTTTNLIDTNISAGSINVTNETVGTSRITTSLVAVGNSNTLGNLFTTGGNVGIGTTSPSSTLNIFGNTTSTVLSLGNGTSGCIIQLNDIPNAAWQINTGGYQLSFANGSVGNYTSKMAINTAGTLTVVGDIAAFGTISDSRLKTNIEPINTGLNVISQLRPVTFSWKDDIFNEGRRGQSDSGFLAQEVEDIIPHAVSEYNDITSKTCYKNMRHERIIPYLVSAIQELQKTVKELQEKLQ